MSPTTTQITLKDQVQILRDRARDILRMQAIQRYMHKIYTLNLELKDTKNLDEAQKAIDRVAFKLKNLSRTDPDYDDKLKCLESDKQDACENYDSLKKDINEHAENNKKKIEELQTKISQVESGEILISIDEANELTVKAIRKLMYVG